MPVYPLPNSLSGRIGSLPLVLAGPILRRVEPGQVSVWLATKLPTPVTLQVFEEDGTTLRMQGTAGANDGVSQINVGINLFLTCVTATPAAGGPLVPGKIYLYSLTFSPGQTLTSANVLTTAGGASALQLVAYTGSYQMPSFCLPGNTLASLRVAHASCRKPHAESLDAMQILDATLSANAKTPSARPQQLVLTGDQIYADDVGDLLLAMLTDAGDALLGEVEELPGFQKTTAPKDLLPGQRKAVAVNQAGFSINVGASGNDQVGDSHLFSLGEFFAMYLMVFADTLWPPTLPTFEQVYPADQNPGVFSTKQKTVQLKGQPPKTVTDSSKLFLRYQQQSANVAIFKAFLPFCRRALANIATYMILDDHELTDDFYMNRAWMDLILTPSASKPAFPVRIIQNGLTAYALFQHWGNRPTQLASEPQWPIFVKAVGDWIKSGFDTAGAADPLSKIQAALTLPSAKLAANAVDVPLTPTSVVWSYAIRWAIHELLVVDTRARRGFPSNQRAEPVLLSENFTLTEVVRDTIGAPALPQGAVTFVVIPSSIVPIPFIDSLKRAGLDDVDKAFDRDVESLDLSANVFDKVLSGLAARTGSPNQLVILSGDVHYGYAASLQHWIVSDFHTASATVAAAHFISSAARNQLTDSLFASTVRLHNNGFGVIRWQAAPAPETRFVWNVPTANDGRRKLVVGTTVAPQTSAGDSLRADIDAGYSAGAPSSGGTTSKRLAAIIGMESVAGPFAKVAVTVVPHAVTRTALIQATGGANRGVNLTPVQSLPTDTKPNRAAGVGTAQSNAIVNVQQKSPGTQLVGVNNIGIITFGTGTAIQELWWWLGDVNTLAKQILDQLSQGTTPLNVPVAQPFSKFEVPLTTAALPTLDAIKG